MTQVEFDLMLIKFILAGKTVTKCPTGHARNSLRMRINHMAIV